MMNVKTALITKIKMVNNVMLFGVEIQSGTRWSILSIVTVSFCH